MLRRPARGERAIFTQPIRQIVSMVLVLVLVAVGTLFAGPSVLPVFLSNRLLSGFIFLVFLFGVAACFWQVLQLMVSVRWIESFVREEDTHSFSAAPRLLAPLATLLRSRGRAMQISASSSRSILDSVATRIDEARDITRYIVNLLIFLGLLGTFYGLATTVPAIVDTIRALAPAEGEDGLAIFGRLMDGLETQLGGMGVAFGSSLLGLAGSLIVGLLELFASHGQNRFYRELEEWLSSITRLGLAAESDVAGGEGGDGQDVLLHVAAQIDRLEELFTRGEAARTRLEDRLAGLADGIGRTGTDDATREALGRIATGQARMIELMEDAADGQPAGIDAEARMRLRSIDVQLLRLIEEIAAGRQETTQELRHELRLLSRAVGRTSTG